MAYVTTRIEDLKRCFENSKITAIARNNVIRFDGTRENYKQWRASLEKYFIAINAKGDSKVQLISPFITGKAEDLINEFINTNLPVS